MCVEERELIELYWKREESAIVEADQLYKRYCMSIGHGILGEVEDVEECFNDVRLKIWNSIPPKRPESLKAYFGKIMRSTSIDRYRKNRTRKRGGGQIEAVLDELEECLSGNAHGAEPLQMLEQQELARLINTFLGELSAEKRVLFVRRYWYGDSIAQAAKRCGISETKATTSLYRLRKQLQERLKKEGF